VKRPPIHRKWRGRGRGFTTMEAANTFADRFNIAHRYGSYEELVSDPDVDAVYVGTPHPMHLANANSRWNMASRSSWKRPSP